MTGRARDMILDPEQTDRLREVIGEGEFYGMQTFDQALLHHYQAGRITMEAAVAAASSPHDFKLLVAGEGRTATSMNDLQRSDRQHEPAGSDRPAQAAPPAPPRPVATPAGPASNGRGSAPPPGFAG
jgi:twitching motility protein PilT